MESLNYYQTKSIEKLIAKRTGETKFGEAVRFISDLKELENHQAKYVLVGLPEDIGVRGNHGKPGTARAWKACLKALLNIQANEYTHAHNLILLGEINCEAQMLKAKNIDKTDPNYYEKLGDLVTEIDKKLTEIIQKIVSAGKTPIIIGGGHNNAFGNIKGTSTALEQPINILNIDAHTDLRKSGNRHSGNGFTYAFEQNFLAKYAIFGLHQNYTSEYIFEQIKNSEHIKFQLFEDLIYNEQKSVITAFAENLEFIKYKNFGLEVDCDSIKFFPTSAQSPTGFSIEEIRSFINLVAKDGNCRYLHLCEAAPTPENDSLTGKALAYFITDFMRAN